jgi:hypothetical protein
MFQDELNRTPGSPPCSPGAARARQLRRRPGSLCARTLSVALVCAMCWVLACWCCTRASAAVTHTFEPAPSEALSGGVPASCGKPGCVSGPFAPIEGLTTAGNRVWVGDEPTSGSSRIDAFEAAPRWGFVGPQLDPEDGVSLIGTKLAVGDVGSEEQVYTRARQAGQEVVAVYGWERGPARTRRTGRLRSSPAARSER